jgi:hypothetical protein
MVAWTEGSGAMARELEQWGGEVRLPAWLRRLLRRPDAPGDTPERAHEGHRPPSTTSVLQNADRAAMGALTEMYAEGRRNRPQGAGKRPER